MAKKRKPKMGRPPKKAKDRRSKPVTLRMVPAEHRELVSDAKAAGLSISEYLLTCWRKVRL
jgi:predicted HicB family RNase H-like nuclease